MLVGKIEKWKKKQCHEYLENERFVLPHYGGSGKHFCNIVLSPDKRVWIKAHLHKNAFDVFVKIRQPLANIFGDISNDGLEIYDCDFGECYSTISIETDSESSFDDWDD